MNRNELADILQKISITSVVLGSSLMIFGEYVKRSNRSFPLLYKIVQYLDHVDRALGRRELGSLENIKYIIDYTCTKHSNNKKIQELIKHINSLPRLSKRLNTRNRGRFSFISWTFCWRYCVVKEANDSESGVYIYNQSGGFVDRGNVKGKRIIHINVKNQSKKDYTYVFLYLLALMLTDSYGHTQEFKDNFTEIIDLYIKDMDDLLDNRLQLLSNKFNKDILDTCKQFMQDYYDYNINPYEFEQYWKD